MQEFTCCKDAIESCVNNQYFAIAHLYNEEKPMSMHIHDCYEIYYSISGGRQFLIDNRFYDIKPGDLFIINQYESHHLSRIDKEVHERIVISIYPDLLKSLSTEQTDLNFCFSQRGAGYNHKISLSSQHQKRFLYFINKITSANSYGRDIIEKSVFMEMMVMINHLYRKIQQDETIETAFKFNQQVELILAYINQNIKSPISITHLAAHFYLSESYICRIFKSVTGTTINKYIVARRITIAKALLATGLNVNDVCEQCGFNDYSNFLKSFTKAVGISPKKYAQLSIS